ncbi:hypothetical protein, partial [Litorivivens sp.]
MAHVIGTYQCEWKTTIDNEDKVKMFRSFVNSNQGDDNVVFVQERGQIRPATDEERELGKDLIAVA